MEKSIVSYKMGRTFNEFFNSKGLVAPLAEKSVNNYKEILRNPLTQNHRLHHFAVGHKFKDIKSAIVFQNEFDETTGKMVATDYTCLKEERFHFTNDAVWNLLDNIRNLNSHYVHTFDKLDISLYDNRLLDFLKEAFRMATTMAFFKEKGLWEKLEKESARELSGDYSSDDYQEALSYSYRNYIASPEFETEYKTFLKDRFFSLNNKKKMEDMGVEELEKLKPYTDLRESLHSLTINECIDFLLFEDVEQDIEWILNDDHKIMTIKQGKYFSFIGCLFFTSLFLYKGEAEKLISKIKGYKRNDDNEMRSKREAMTFFAKKLSSQDYNSEEKQLIFFRDLIQYLNKYPVAWKQEFETETPVNLKMAEVLEDKIAMLEIERLFPTMLADKDFVDYAHQRLFKRNAIIRPKKPIYADIINKDDQVRAIYEEISNNTFNSKKYKGVMYADYALKYVVKTYFSNVSYLRKYKEGTFRKDREFRERLNTNKPVEKLTERIKNHLLFTSWGRNQDRFIDFAVRYLAETNYFGEEAKFKVYRFQTTDEQNSFLEQQPKEVLDKLIYHDGRVTHFISYPEHLKIYREWDTPFVVQNNGIQISIILNEKEGETTIGLQRDLLVYLLQDCLYNETPKAKGQVLLKRYYAKHRKELNEVIEELGKEETLSSGQKTDYKKLVPRRLLKHYNPSNGEATIRQNAFQKLLEEAQAREKRYEDLRNYKYEVAKTTRSMVYANFLQKNKGKQFKLQFIRKAWHIIYFRNIYGQYAQDGHHKSLHITRNEFNDFCRYMFAFNTVPGYKELLHDLLDSKHFFENKEFEALFNQGNSLNDFYERTKKVLKDYIAANKVDELDEDKYKLQNYSTFLQHKILYINLSHFIKHLESEGTLRRNSQGNYQYPALENNPYLIPQYYYKEKIEREEYKVDTQEKLYNKLRKTRLEDCLLYEMAIRYLKKEEAVANAVKNDVRSMFTQSLDFDIKDKSGVPLYTLQVPFKQLEKYVGMQKLKDEKEKKFTSYLSQIPSYIEKAKGEKDIKPIWADFNENKILTLDALTKVQGHVVSQTGKFTVLSLELEKYYVGKLKLLIAEGQNRIDYKDIVPLKDLYNAAERNTASHFGLPDEVYQAKITRIEKLFISKHIDINSLKNYSGISKAERNILDIFLETIHNDYFKREKGKKGKEIRDSAEKTYFESLKKI